MSKLIPETLVSKKDLLCVEEDVKPYSITPEYSEFVHSVKLKQKNCSTEKCATLCKHMG